MFGLESQIRGAPESLADSQLLYWSKELHQIESEASKILERVTEYSKQVTDAGASGQWEEINKLLTDTITQKDRFVLAVQKEMGIRDLSEEKIKSAQGLKIKLPKFTGYDSTEDIYTFQKQFEKFVTPYVSRPRIADTLKIK